MTTSGTAAVVWSRVEDGFYVASLPGVFIGFVERTAGGRFRARDGFSRIIGTTDDLTGATRLVAAATTPSAGAESARIDPPTVDVGNEGPA